MSAIKGQRGSLLFLLAFLAMTLLTLSCYTVVHHPQSMKVTSRDYSSASPHGGENACSECHYDSEWLGFYDHPLIYGVAGYYSYDWWYDYYQRPWWFDDLWYGDTGSGSEGGRGQSSWTQRSLRRGESRGAPTNTSGPKLSPTGSGTSSGPSIGASGQSSKPEEKKEKAPAPSYGKKKRNPRR